MVVIINCFSFGGLSEDNDFINSHVTDNKTNRHKTEQ